MTPFRLSWLPHPVTSLSLLLVWLVLHDTTAPGHVLLGAVLAIAIPLFTKRFWADAVAVRRPWLWIKLGTRVLADMFIANFTVARRVIGPTEVLRPAFVQVPLAAQSDMAITVLASVVSLTPGTVSADLEPDRRHLLVHVLDLEDEAALIATIKTRYEALIREMLP